MAYKKLLLITIYCLALSFSATSELHAQIVDEKFGKNRIQYRLFNWKYYSTPHFEIYYYPGGQYLAKELSKSLESEHDAITDIIGYAPYAKTKVFIYNNNIDLNQSNVGLNEAKFDIAGQTNFLNNQVEIAFSGSYNSFYKDLKYLITKNYVSDMLFGSLFSEVISSSYLVTLPDWYISGIASYVAYGWDEETDDFVREYLKNEKLSNITKLEGKRAQLAGQAIWNFIAEDYGRINISSVLNLTRIIRNEEKSISNALGVTYTNFFENFKEFYLKNNIDNSQSLPAEDNKVAKSLRNDHKYNFSISPNGKWLAYSVNKNGRFKIDLENLENGSTKTILKGGVKRFDNNEYTEAPIFDWGDSATLGIVDYERGVNILKLYNPYSKTWTLRSLRKFEQINGMDIYPNGKTAVVSVSTKGQSDLYLIGLNNANSRRLTNDVFDDLYPHFIPDTKTIIFSSNRPTDTVTYSNNYNDLENHLNLYSFSIGADEPLKKITNDYANNIQAIPIDSMSVYYLSSRSGIYNLYKHNIKEGVSQQLTAYPTSISEFSVSESLDLIGLSLKEGAKTNLYLMPFKRNMAPNFQETTLRKQIQLSRLLPNRITNNTKNKPKNELSAITDSISINNIEPEATDSLFTEKLNPDDFSFESNKAEITSKQSSLALNLKKLRKEPTILGPLDYEPSFKIDNVTFSFLFDPLFGFSPYVEYQMNDLLENNRFIGGITSTVFNQSAGNTTRFYGEYQYLPRLIDYSIRLERKSMEFFINQDLSKQKYAYNKLSVNLSYPFSTSTRITAGPFIGTRSFVESSISIFSPAGNINKSPIQNEFLYGSSVELVYENSEVLGFNIRQGSRGKIAIENYNFGNDFSSTFFKLSVDLRNYQKIFKEITFATRLYAGSYFGNNTPNFLLGGVTNWATLRRNENVRTDNNIDTENNRNPLAVTSVEDPYENNNLLFHEIVTGLRGFRINELYGTKTILLSNELRIPLFRALSKKAIKSSFIRNFQIIGFYDIGTAWLGGNPWDSDNSINTETVIEVPFSAKIQNYKNPWLSSTGVGLSTVLFGYYGTIYYTLPIEDYSFKEPQLLVGIGFNF